MALTLTVGQAEEISAQAVEGTNQWDDATTGQKNYVWTTSAPTVAVVRGSGNTVTIAGVGAGSAVISCAVDGNTVVTENVTVAAAAPPAAGTTITEDDHPRP